MNPQIVVVGDGWGAISAYKGLSKRFGKISVITTDDEIINLVSNNNYVVDSFYGINNKVLVFSGYKNIVPDDVLESNICINIHYSLLPKYRGIHSTVWAILNDEEKLGLSVHVMNKDLDDGEIIHQFAYKNDRISNSREIMERNNKYIENNIGDIIYDYLEGKIVTLANDKSKATWVGRRSLNDCKIDFNKPINYQRCFFRALVNPYPLPYVVFKGKKYEITKVDFHLQNVETHVGRILNIDNDGLWVKVCDGYLIIKEMMDNCNIVNIKETFKIGQRFE